MQAYYIAWGKGAERLERVLEKAKRERRQITAEEMQEIVEANGGRVPTLARQDSTSKVKLE